MGSVFGLDIITGEKKIKFYVLDRAQPTLDIAMLSGVVSWNCIDTPWINCQLPEICMMTASRKNIYILTFMPE